jgi:hypothetical protein
VCIEARLPAWKLKILTKKFGCLAKFSFSKKLLEYVDTINICEGFNLQGRVPFALMWAINCPCYHEDPHEIMCFELDLKDIGSCLMHYMLPLTSTSSEKVSSIRNQGYNHFQELKCDSKLEILFVHMAIEAVV